jgi:hypothetical protein
VSCELESLLGAASSNIPKTLEKIEIVQNTICAIKKKNIAFLLENSIVFMTA